MVVEAKVKSICKIDIEAEEAFYILCKTLDMDFVLDEDKRFFVRKDSDDELRVYIFENGHDELFDDRGKMFVALRNVAINLYPNLLFRNAEYIY